jgi:ABC-type branched-subunit amino acid transport system ATPase component/ABC-type branched-subunit amino acid transport system permease subunit
VTISLKNLSPRNKWILGIAAGLAAGWALAYLLLPKGLPEGVLVLGLVLGGLQAMTAMGLVLVFRAARIVNFAQAQMGALGATGAVISVAAWHLPFLASLLIGLAVAAICGLLVDALVGWRFAKSPRLILTVATIGIAEILGALAIAAPLPFHLSPLSTFTSPWHVSFSLGPVLFNANDVLAMLVIPVVGLLLWWFLGRTDTGTAIRASAESEERALLLGLPVRRLARISWVVAGVLSGLGAMLSAAALGPNVGVASGPTVLLLPLAAAVLAGFESLPVAFGASLVLGTFQQAMFWSYPNSSSVNLGFLIVVIGGLLALPVMPWSRSARGSFKIDELGDHVAVREPKPLEAHMASKTWVKAMKVVAAAATLAALVLVPMALGQPRQILLANVAIYGLVAVSLVILTGWAGQVSLGQFAFVGIGAAVGGALLSEAHVGLLAAMAAAGTCGGLVALLIGIPALRLPGLHLAVATLALAVVVSTWLLSSAQFPMLNPSVVRRPVLLGRFPLRSPLSFYELCAVMLALGVVVAWNLRRSRAGRVMRAVRDNPAGAASFGVNPTRVKLLAFATAGCFAGIAGALYVVGLRGLGSAGISPSKSLAVFTMVVLGGLGSLPGALLGAGYVEGVTAFLSGAAQLLATGAGILVVLAVFPEGLGGLLYRARDAVFSRRPPEPHSVSPRSSQETYAGFSEPPARASGTIGPSLVWRENPILSINRLSASYGTVPVLREVSLDLARGEILALLGTNGAGKSTLLKVLSGLLGPSGGYVSFNGEEITGLSPAARIAKGLSMMPSGHNVFFSLTTEENLRLAGTRMRGKHPGLYENWLEWFQAQFPAMTRRMSLRAGWLSGGERQMLSLSQALLAEPRVLLVDELSMGLAPPIVDQIVATLKLLASRGTAVIAVEQSLPVAQRLADRAVFLERGSVRFDGAMSDLTKRRDLLRSLFLAPEPELVSQQDDVQRQGRPATRHSEMPPGSLIRSSGSPTTAALELEAISKRYGGVAAIRDVSFSVGKGEILGLLGANGAGKTSLLDIASGFMAPDTGRVSLNGEDVTHNSAAQRAWRGMGRIFQDARIFPGMTVREAISVALERSIEVRDPLLCALAMPAATWSEKAVRIRSEELIEEMGLGNYAQTEVRELSVGTKRIVEIACAMAHGPSVLLADEPSSGIAQAERDALRELLIGFSRKNHASIVVVEHDIALLASMADRLICLDLGEKIAEGTPEQVLSDPRVLACYLGAAPDNAQAELRLASAQESPLSTSMSRGSPSIRSAI